MRQSPTGSFLRFTIGFLVFISVSFAVTFGVNTYTTNQAKAAAAAAAHEALFGKAK